MVNEPAAEEAVRLARENPRLGVGLHLSLVCGKAALAREDIPALVDERGQFSNDPVGTGCRYFFSSTCRAQLAAEIEQQFARFRTTGLPLDHVNGHLNLHLHPVIFRILMENAERWGIRATRLTRDDFWLSARLAGGKWGYRISHAIIYSILSARSRGELARRKIRHTSAVFGLLQNGRVDAAFVRKLLPQLPPGQSELYSHPSMDHSREEFDALIDPVVLDLVRQLGVELIRYQDLT